jgi:hypothetical protein
LSPFDPAPPLLDWATSPYIAAFFALSGLFAEMSTSGSMNFTGRKVAVYKLSDGNGKLQGDGLKVISLKWMNLFECKDSAGYLLGSNQKNTLNFKVFSKTRDEDVC